MKHPYERHPSRRETRLLVALLLAVPLMGGTIAPPATADENRMSGRRNGTLQGPSIRGIETVRSARFRQFQFYGRPCHSDQQSKCGGVGHVLAGAGLRNAGTGTLRLRGVPPGATLEAAYLYLGLIESPATQGLPIHLAFAGYEVAMQFVAGHGDHGWESSPGLLVPGVATLYRANVTNIVSAMLDPFTGANGDYEVIGAPTGVDDQSDPFDCMTAVCNPQLPLNQGVSLLVVYRHERLPKSSVVYIHEPYEQVPFLASALKVGHGLTPAAPARWEIAYFSSIGGDGQTRDPDPVFQAVAPISTHLTLGLDAGFIRGPSSDIEPSTDWIGLDGGTVPQLWGGRRTTIYRHELGNANGTPISAYGILYEAHGSPQRDYDCVNPSVHVLGLISN